MKQIAFDRSPSSNHKDILIIPSLKINFKNNILYLNSIIIHKRSGENSGHYNTLYQCNDIWYLYDDMNIDNKITKIGTFDNVIKNDKYATNIIGLFAPLC